MIPIDTYINGKAPIWNLINALNRLIVLSTTIVSNDVSAIHIKLFSAIFIQKYGVKEYSMKENS